MPQTSIAADEPSCPICGSPVQRKSLGRPPTYDRPTCRKKAARRRVTELARLGRAVEKALAGQARSR
jgi:hypothetical protein